MNKIRIVRTKIIYFKATNKSTTPNPIKNKPAILFKSLKYWGVNLARNFSDKNTFNISELKTKTKKNTKSGKSDQDLFSRYFK